MRDWTVAADSLDNATEVALRVVDWCKEVMAASRRPYGMDQFDLAIAFRGEDLAAPVRKMTFNRLRVLELYEDSFAQHLAEALGAEIGHMGPRVLHVAAGLFSWGDALHAALPQTEPSAG